MTMTEVEAAWINYASHEGRYGVALPNQPKMDTEKAGGKPKSYRTMSTSPPAVFLVQYFDLGPDEVFSIDDWLKSEIKESSTILASKPINVGGFPGHQLVESGKDST